MAGRSSHLLLMPLFALILNLSNLVTAARFCSRGTFHSDGKCIPCPPGTYRSEWFSQPKYRCVPCPAGTYNPHPGVGTDDLCRPCPALTYAPVRGATKCLPCPTGTASRLGASVCLACPPGQRPAGYRYGSQWTPKECEDCPVNTYSAGKVGDCTPCPEGMGAPKRSSSLSDCKNCPAGMTPDGYSPDPCTRCHAGRFAANEGSSVCINCPNGSVQPKKGSSKCIPCPVGTRSDPWNEKCVDCPEGTTTFSEGNTMCRAIGGPCPSWRYESNEGDCRQCPDNHVPNDARTGCVPCPRGTRSRGGGTLKCIPCPAGLLATRRGDECRCPQGRFIAADGSCKKCPPGSFTSDNYIGWPVTECIKCREGIAVGWGNTYCKLCPGQKLPNEEGTKCVDCGPGLTRHVPSWGGDDDLYCVNITTGCRPGFKRNDSGVPCTVVTCQPGTDASLVGVTCLPCGKGYALVERKAAKMLCERCPEDSVSDGGVITGCKKCENGMLGDDSDWSKCSCRAPGYGIGKDGICKKCERGFFARPGKEVCTKCPPGTMTVKKGQSYCTKCERGTFKAVRGPGNCKKCPAGQVPNYAFRATGCIPRTSEKSRVLQK